VCFAGGAGARHPSVWRLALAYAGHVVRRRLLALQPGLLYVGHVVGRRTLVTL
jgi:hypothetical protein